MPLRTAHFAVITQRNRDEPRATGYRVVGPYVIFHLPRIVNHTLFFSFTGRDRRDRCH